jgi:hypothetical protein
MHSLSRPLLRRHRSLFKGQKVRAVRPVEATALDATIAGFCNKMAGSQHMHATAASIWTVGIMGAAVGYGYYDIGIILTMANLAVLTLRIRS